MDEKKKNLYVSIVCVVACLIISRIAERWIPSVGNVYMDSFIAEAIFMELTLAALIYLKRTDVLALKTEGFAEGFGAGTVIIVISMFSLLGFCFGRTPVTVSHLEFLVFAYNMLLIGVAEEVLFRGIIQNAVMDVIGYDSVGKIRKGIIISGALFASVHLLNAFVQDISFLAALRQAITIIPVGALFGTIYYRSRNNIWVVVLLHAFNDFCVLIFTGYISNKTMGEAVSSTSTNVVGSLIFYILVDLWVMRKEKLLPTQQLDL